MNVFNKVTLQSLKKNKTRTIVTIIGIMLSAAMICAVTTFVSSVQNYLLDRTIYTEGDWHGSVTGVDADTYTDIKTANKVSSTTYNHILGYAKIDSVNEYKPYMYVIGAQQDSFFDMMPVHLVSGNLPKNTNEILIPNHVLSNSGLTYKVGDKITLEIGDRQLDGFSMGQNNPAYSYDSETKEEVLNDEIVKVETTRTYTVVGIYERPEFEDRTAPGYTAITVSDKEFDGEAKFDVYFKMKNPSDLYKFMEELDLGASYNHDLLMFMGVSQFSSLTGVLVSLASIVIALIMFGSISLIYNAFAISISERTKQFGLLSSIGATKKQLKKMVLFEALSVSAVGIPLGILVGIGGIGVTLLLIGDKFTAMFSGYPEPMRVCVSWIAVVAAIIIALITVLISAWIPSKRATKVSAVEAIRQNIDIKAKNKPVKTSKLTYKLFGLPGVIASKHYKRNKKKYRTTVISLFMSIVLFVSASAFTDYLMETMESGFATENYDIQYFATTEEMGGKTADEVLALLSSDEKTTNGAYVYHQFCQGTIDEKYLTEEFLGLPNGDVDDNGVQVEEGHKVFNAVIYFVNDTEFDKLVEKYNLNRSDYYNPENPLSIAVDESTAFDASKEKFVTLDALNGDKSEISYHVVKQIEGYEYSDVMNLNGVRYHVYRNPNNGEDILQIPYEEGFVTSTLKIGKAIGEKPFYVRTSTSTHAYLIYPISMYKNVVPVDAQYEFMYRFYLQTEDHAASYNNIKGILLENGIDTEQLYDYAADEEEERNVVTIIQVFSYGFIVLISLIAAANVFNTISTNISLRRREFAMLKSVGMTEKGFNKMMNFECLLYGSKALLLGLPVSAGITFLIYRSVSDGFETSYHLPWAAIGISVLSVFLVVFATMLYSMSKIKKENPIDALKNENL